MTKRHFLDLVPLPRYEGLPLAATGVRSLERFSDLAAGVARRAPLEYRDRVDVMDECLDLVILRPETPAGFELTGLSLAELWAALGRSGQPEGVLATWRQILQGADMQALREAARARIAMRPPYVFLEQCWLRLPSLYRDAPLVALPTPLAGLLGKASPDWRPSRRCRHAVELIEEVGARGYRLPTRGRRFPTGRAPVESRWLRWEDQRLQPQHGDPSMLEYSEYQLALPSLEESYFSDHFMARNVFAHFRATRFSDTEGRSVLVLDEVQSDWLRDLRRQRRGKPRKGAAAGPPSSIPDCPVERHWLAIALAAFLDRAQEQRCDLIAWVPGGIQAELNPGLPLSVARRLYDRRVPRTLARLLGGRTWAGVEGRRLEVGYPTYGREVLLQHRRARGWLLVGPDGETPASEPVKTFDAILDLFRTRATPVCERLPAMDPWEAAGGIPLEPGRLPEPEDAEILWIGQGPDGAEKARRIQPMQTSAEHDRLLDTARELTEEEAGGHGNRWGAFADDLDTFVETWLPVAVEQGQVVTLGVADGSGHEGLVAEVSGMGLLYADREEDRGRVGMLAVIAMDIEGPDGERTNVLASAFPFFADGLAYPVQVQEIALYPNRLEARLELAVAGTLVFAFDPIFYQHRGLYRQGEASTFSLAALAYEMAPTGGEEIVIDDPERIRAFRARDAWVEAHGGWTREDEAAALAAWAPAPPEDLEPIRIDLSRGAMLLPGEEGPADDAFYQGEVTRVVPGAYILFGVSLWRVEVVVARPDDQALVLPFYVPEHRFAEGWRPGPGDYVKGSAWVQGYLVRDADATDLH
jgi:hypothetical protein